jgi:hypothetical protein
MALKAHNLEKLFFSKEVHKLEKILFYGPESP